MNFDLTKITPTTPAGPTTRQPFSPTTPAGPTTCPRELGGSDNTTTFFSFHSLLSDKVKTDCNSKIVYLNSLLVQKSLEISKYKDKYDSLKIKSINTIKQLCNSNNEKTDTINKLLTEQGEINC